jgi:hypothetical protein
VLNECRNSLQHSSKGCLNATQGLISFENLDYRKVIKKGANTPPAQLISGRPGALSNGGNGGVLVGKDPRLGLEEASALPDMVGAEHAASPKRLKKYSLGVPGPFAETVPGPRGGSLTYFEAAMALQEARGFTIRHAQTMGESGGHGPEVACP